MAYDVYVFDEKINSTTTSANSIKWSGSTTLKDYMDINDSYIQQQFLTQSRQIDGVTNAVATPYVSGTTYNPGEYVMYSLKTWKCLVANNETPSEGANWTKVIIADEISSLNDTLTSYVTSTNVYCYGNNSATTLQETTFNVPSGYTALVAIPYSASGSTNAYTDLYSVAVSSSGTTGTVQTRWTSAIATTAYVRVKVILVKED